MIEKITPDHILGLDGLPTTIMPDSAKLMRKINELVDAVNELQTRAENVQQDTTKGLLTLVEEPKPADPYAEQRKWIGKLCKFRDDETEKPKIGVLKDIDVFVGDYNALYITFINATDNNSYFECEPVKLDDDIIYKGE